MAGKLIVDTIDTDNAFIRLNVQQTTVATINASGILSNTGTIMVRANGTFSNSALVGTINGSQIASNTVSNTNIQTGAIENYSRANGLLGMRNRIINGTMVIDQRNAGANTVITNTGAVTYTLDRWYVYGAQASKFSVQQNAGSVTPPAGFTNYLGVTSTTSYSSISTDAFQLSQKIEGLNTVDLAWGTSNAKPITLSFQVYSSLTGTFAGSLRNSAANRSYPFTYTMSSSNTWEQKTITISGDITGTWLANNGTGIDVTFNLGSGSTYSGTAGSWQSGNYLSATGATSVVGTSGATFYITGVQLEAGSVATNYEYRQHQQELALCHRYYETSYDTGTAVGAAATPSYSRWSTNGTANALEKLFKVTKRATPTVSTYDTSGNAGKVRIFDNTTDPANITPTAILGNMNAMWVTYNSSANGLQFNYTANAEL